MVEDNRFRTLFSRIEVECDKELCFGTMEFLAERTSVSESKLVKYLSIEHGLKIYKGALRSVVGELVSKNVLQVMHPRNIEDIALDFDRSGTLGPLLGYPDDEDIDFTSDGSELWKHVLGVQTWTDYACTVDLSIAANTRLLVSSQKSFLESSMATLSDQQKSNLSGPFPIGRWAERWWRVFDSGYAILVPGYGNI